MNARIALCTDLSSLGKSSLTVMIPALEMLGVEACPVATALLSTQTDGFLDPYVKDAGDSFGGILDTWQRLGFSFQGIYTGYFTSLDEVRRASRFLEDNPRSLSLCDPVLGDNGTLYQGLPDGLLEAIRDELAPKADWISPNATEAGLLLGLDRPVEPDDCPKLPGRHHLITGYESDGKWMVVMDEGTVGYQQYPASYPGTGDLFDAIFLAQLVKGVDPKQVVEQTVTLVALACSRTHRERKYGIDVTTIRRELVTL